MMFHLRIPLIYPFLIHSFISASSMLLHHTHLFPFSPIVYPLPLSFISILLSSSSDPVSIHCHPYHHRPSQTKPSKPLPSRSCHFYPSLSILLTQHIAFTFSTPPLSDFPLTSFPLSRILSIHSLSTSISKLLPTAILYQLAPSPLSFTRPISFSQAWFALSTSIFPC